MKNTIILKPPVRDRPKCQDIVVAYTGEAYIENRTDTSFSATRKINSSQSQNFKTDKDMSFSLLHTLVQLFKRSLSSV